MVSDDWDDPAAYGQPLHPDDRLWRHPSEMAGLTGPARRTPPIWATVIISALGGAMLVASVWIATNDDTPQVIEVTELVSQQTVSSTPKLVSADQWATTIGMEATPAVVGISSWVDGQNHHGSGVVVRSDGHIVTTAGLVGDDNLVRVTFPTGETYSADTIYVDWVSGIAVLDVDGSGYDTAVTDPTNSLRKGSSVVVQAWAGTPVASHVVATSVDRGSQDPTLHGLVELDMAISTAWSGAPILDNTGAVIGITVSNPQGHGLGIPVSAVGGTIDEIIATGKATHARLPVTIEDAGPDGVVLAGAEGSAAAAGLTGGDVIVSLGGFRVHTAGDLAMAARDHDPGQAVEVEFRRADETHRKSVVLEAE